MLSWKVWTTFVIVCISCVEYWHSNSCVSLINCCTTWSCSCWLKQVMVTWVQPRHQGSLSILCIFVHISYTLKVTLFTFGKYLPIQFSNMIKIRFFAFVKCLPLRFSCFSIFSNLFACRALFAYFWTHCFFSFLSCIPSDELFLSVLWLTYLPLFHYCLWFYTDLSLTELVHCYELHCLPRNNPTTICKACAYFIFLNRILPSKHQATSCIQRFFFFCPMILSGSGECIGPFHFLF